MSEASCFTVLLSKDRITECIECDAEQRSFAEPVVDFQCSRSVPLICLVTGVRNFSHVGLGRRGSRARTGLRRSNLDKVEELSQDGTF
jgi:hypothetical protein